MYMSERRETHTYAHVHIKWETEWDNEAQKAEDEHWQAYVILCGKY